MHNAVKSYCLKVKEKYPEYFKGSMVDFGSLDVNGNNRYLSEGTYIGVDIVSGENVDYVSKCHEFKSEPFDVVISTEMLEHDPYWELSLKKMESLTKGLMIITCATTGRPNHSAYEGKYKLPKNFPDFYRNISKEDIEKVLDLEKFKKYELESNYLDIHFMGVK